MMLELITIRVLGPPTHHLQTLQLQTHIRIKEFGSITKLLNETNSQLKQHNILLILHTFSTHPIVMYLVSSDP